MAKWNITPRTQGNSMSTDLHDLDVDRGRFDYKISQDVNGILENAKMDRDIEDYFGKSKNGFRKAFTIPDVVAIEIKLQHDLDVYDEGTMRDPASKAKLFAVIDQHYPHLKSTNGALI